MVVRISPDSFIDYDYYVCQENNSLRVQSFSSSPGSPGTKADFTPDRNKHLKKNITHLQNACTTRSHNIFALSLLSHVITILYAFDMMILAI